MCLITDREHPDVAKEDIVCYKVLVRNRDGKTGKTLDRKCRKEFLTPWHFRNVGFGEILKADGEKSVVRKWKSWIVEKGYIHCFSDKDGAYAYAWMLNTAPDSSIMERNRENRIGECGICVVECVIRKGVEFFKGTNGDICATKINVGSSVLYEI